MHLQDQNMEPAEIDEEPTSRQHTQLKFYADTHSLMDDVLISQKMLSNCKATTTALVLAATDDSDHLPILAQTPLNALDFVPPGPELPVPDKVPTLKVPLTETQKTDFKKSK